MTNEEKLKQMTPERLAKKFCLQFSCLVCPMFCKCSYKEDEDNGFLKWLHEEDDAGATNYDKFKLMSTEEIADLFCHQFDKCISCKAYNLCSPQNGKNAEGFVQLLKQKAWGG